MADATIVIPVFNSAPTLQRAIQSVRQQSLSNFEALIVDDGSTDESLHIAQREAAADSRIRVIPVSPNQGKPNAMNLAISQANGRWIAVLDADDRYEPERLQRLIEMGDQRQVDLVADNQIHIDHLTGEIVRYAFDIARRPQDIGLQDLIKHSDPGAPFDFGILKPIIRREFIRAHDIVYFPTARFAEDFYYLLDFFASGGRGYLVPDPLYEWTLPFSSAAREWSKTGRGAWRYDYRNALDTNRAYRAKYAKGDRSLQDLLKRRDRDYRVMVDYLDAQRLMEEDRRFAPAAAIIARSPGTWPLLARRVIGRLSRRASGRSAS